MATKLPSKVAHIKWAGPNTPFIRMADNDHRLYLTKRELVELMQEIQAFTTYYKDDFTASTIDLKDDTMEDGLYDTTK
jgi:hypothetical protein